MKAPSSTLETTARVLLGIGFLIPGLNGFFHFMPFPPMPDAAMAFLGALGATGYLFPLLKTVEIVGALMLLSNRFVPLALTVLAPALVNILAFHLVLAPAGLPMPLVLLALEVYLAWACRDAFRPMLRSKKAGAPQARQTDGHLAVA